MSATAPTSDSAAPRRRRTTAVLGGAGLAITMLALAVVFATAGSTARVADNARALHWSNATAGSSAVARAAVAQAVVFAIDHDFGVADVEARDAAVIEATRNLDEVQRWFDGAPLLLATQLDPELGSDIVTFITAGRTTVALAAAGDSAAADIAHRTDFEPTYGPVAEQLAAQQAAIAAQISDTEHLAGMIGTVTQVLATLLIPALAILVFFFLVRRQYREARVQMDAKLAAERELSRAKEEFIAGVSHELRTPLTGIYGFSEYLLDHGLIDPDEAIELIGHINQEASELSRMVEDLLTAARLDSDELSIHPESVSVLSAVDDVVTPLRRSGAKLEIEGDALFALADPARLRQIVRNLVSNALKHGGPRIRVLVDAAGDMIRVTVADNGPGADPDLKDALFTRFVHGGRDALLTGSVGLGLAISRSLARRMEGDITYLRVVGWTNFIVELPAATSTADPPPADDVPEPAILRLDAMPTKPGRVPALHTLSAPPGGAASAYHYTVDFD